MRKRIVHWCSVVPEKSRPSGPPSNGKLGKARFPLERWALRLQASFPTGTVGPRVWIFLSALNTNDGFYLSNMGSDVGQIFPTASLHRDHSILYALVCDKEISHIGKYNVNPDLVCEKIVSHIPRTFVLTSGTVCKLK